ncbi:hypothetical protein [Methanobrevibacter sp.]|uniref:hypothetical protein n=1 Tax=Methanobrevibacter sp. TaxID=66852 RepID=UPI00386ED8B0
MNFNVVEGSKSFWDEKLRFIKLYNNGVLSKEIREICNLTSRQYCKLVKECSKEGSIISRRKVLLGDG